MTAVVALLSALIGAVSGLSGAALTSRAASRDARDRQRREIAAERMREGRVAIGHFPAVVAACIQTIDWFVWQAARRPTRFSSATTDEYDDAIKAQFPQLMEAMARVAAISPSAFTRFGSVAERVFRIDRDVSDAATTYAEDPARALTALAAYEDRSDELFWEFQAELARWAGEAETTRPLRPAGPVDIDQFALI